MDLLSDFSERLKELLFDNKLSLDEFAAKVGVSLNTVYRWMKNPMQIKRRNLIAVADFFECSIEYLIGQAHDTIKFTPKTYLPFGQQIRTVLKACGFTTYSLRKISRFESIYFQKWDAGEEPSLPLLIELANLLGCSIDYLVGRDDQP
ncbi:MAG: helix-turn-helix domain-containing protein [Firmicutes bacterium]|nr:helix-turn-helix domain-containing protein [Bacillota bacterium]